MRRALVAAVVTALAVGSAACGGKNTGMSDVAQRQLTLLVGRVRNAADARDAAGAAVALSQLRAAVHRDRQAGDLSSARASEILGAATQVQLRLALITTTTTTTTTVPPPPPPDDHHDHGKRGGKDHGPGKKGD